MPYFNIFNFLNYLYDKKKSLLYGLIFIVVFSFVLIQLFNKQLSPKLSVSIEFSPIDSNKLLNNLAFNYLSDLVYEELGENYGEKILINEETLVKSFFQKFSNQEFLFDFFYNNKDLYLESGDKLESSSDLLLMKKARLEAAKIKSFPPILNFEDIKLYNREFTTNYTLVYDGFTYTPSNDEVLIVIDEIFNYANKDVVNDFKKRINEVFKNYYRIKKLKIDELKYAKEIEILHLQQLNEKKILNLESDLVMALKMNIIDDLLAPNASAVTYNITQKSQTLEDNGVLSQYPYYYHGSKRIEQEINNLKLKDKNNFYLDESIINLNSEISLLESEVLINEFKKSYENSIIFKIKSNNFKLVDVNSSKIKLDSSMSLYLIQLIMILLLSIVYLILLLINYIFSQFKLQIKKL